MNTMIKSMHIPKGMFLFLCSSMVEQVAVNDKVVGSNPTGGALIYLPIFSFGFISPLLLDIILYF